MSEGSQVSKVTLCVKIEKVAVTQSLSHSVTKVRFRAARAAKNQEFFFFLLESFLDVSLINANFSDES